MEIQSHKLEQEIARGTRFTWKILNEKNYGKESYTRNIVGIQVILLDDHVVSLRILRSTWWIHINYTFAWSTNLESSSLPNESPFKLYKRFFLCWVHRMDTTLAHTLYNVFVPVKPPNPNLNFWHLQFFYLEIERVRKISVCTCPRRDLSFSQCNWHFNPHLILLTKHSTTACLLWNRYFFPQQKEIY